MLFSNKANGFYAICLSVKNTFFGSRQLTGSLDADIEDLVSIGAYKEGTKPLGDEALRKWGAVNSFLRQNKDEGNSFGACVQQLEAMIDA